MCKVGGGGLAPRFLANEVICGAAPESVSCWCSSRMWISCAWACSNCGGDARGW